MNQLCQVGLISLLPIIQVAYIGAAYTIVQLGTEYDPRSLLRRYFSVIYIPFIFGIGGVYLASVGLPPITVRPEFLLGVPVGAGAYYLTTLGWRYYTGNPIRRGDRELHLNAVGVTGALPEELLFRAGLAPLISWVGSTGYLLYSSVLFGVYHYDGQLNEVIFKMLLGVLLGTAYLWSGSVVVPICIHFGYNLAWVLFVTGRFP